jgi:hypothetical protein
LDGAPLKSPYLSTLELTNDGDKPIPQSDFESPVELRLQTGSTVVRAQATASSPKDLEAKITWEGQVVRLAPLLLNPKDSVNITVLTTGERPMFTPRARVAGVVGVTVDDVSGKAPTIRMKVTLLVAALLMLIASDMTNEGLFSRKAFVLRRRSAILITILTGVSGVALFMGFLDALGIREIWQIGLSLIPLLLVTGIAAGIWNWSADAKAEDSVEKPS